MKKLLLITFMALFALVMTSNAQQKFVDSVQKTTTKTYENLSDVEWIEMATEIIVKDNNIPAVTIAIIKDGKVAKYINKGVLNRKTKKPVDENTIFQIGSLTKSFTGIIANNLIKEGKLDVEASITNYLPDAFSPKAKVKLSAIKVKNLLQHQSGIPRDSKVYHRFGNDPMICCYTEEDLLTDLEVMKLDFKPGEKTIYSNMGFAVAGYVLERASGKSYQELVQMYVADKLNLSNTAAQLNERQKTLLATPYRKENRIFETKPFVMGKMTPGGGIYSSASDLAKVMINQMSDYRGYLKNKKETPFILTKDTKPMSQRVSYGYGLFKTAEGGYGHGGDVDGFASAYTFTPSQNIGFLMLTSSGGRWIGKLENAIVSKLGNRPIEMPTLTKTVSIPMDRLIKYTGTYKLGETIFNIVQKGNKLEAYPQSSFGPIEMSFESENKIFSKTYGHAMEFEFGANGEVKKAFYVRSGKKYEMTKVD